MPTTTKPKRINKYLYGWKLYVNYGYGWEYETFEETREAYKVNRQAYRENCTYPQRWTRGRELNPSHPDYVLNDEYLARLRQSPAELAALFKLHKPDSGFPLYARLNRGENGHRVLGVGPKWVTLSVDGTRKRFRHIDIAAVWH